MGIVDPNGFIGGWSPGATADSNDPQGADSRQDGEAKLATITVMPTGDNGPELFRHESLADYTAAVWQDKGPQDQLNDYRGVYRCEMSTRPAVTQGGIAALLRLRAYPDFV